MPVKTADIIRRVQFGASDKQGRRFTLQDIADAMNEGARLLAETTRATTVYQTLTLAAGVNQDLRDAGPSDEYVALRRIEHNLGGGTVRLTDHEALDRAARTWRATSQASQIDEYAVDARQPQRFTVFPPAQAGVQVRALVTPYPARFCLLNGGGTALQNANERSPWKTGSTPPWWTTPCSACSPRTPATRATLPARSST